jgi:hypothetical protein
LGNNCSKLEFYGYGCLESGLLSENLISNNRLANKIFQAEVDFFLSPRTFNSGNSTKLNFMPFNKHAFLSSLTHHSLPSILTIRKIGYYPKHRRVDSWRIPVPVNFKMVRNELQWKLYKEKFLKHFPLGVLFPETH